jgi:hypothetical protein
MGLDFTFIRSNCLQVSEQAFASPAELAKAYMGSKPSKVSPSMLGLRSQALRRNANLLDKVSYPPKMPFHVGIPENGSTNPRYRGRSAVYTMARTPNLKFNPTATQKVQLLANMFLPY